MWSLDKVGCIAKSSQQSFCHLWQNIHYHLTTNLQNHITTNIFDVVRIITSKQQIFSVWSNPDPPILKKIAVRYSPDPAKIGFSPDPVRSSPDLCSSLALGENATAVATSPVVLRWLCDSPRMGCAWRIKPYIYVVRTSNNRVIVACNLWWYQRCQRLNVTIAYAKSDHGMWTLLLLVATVRSFAHMLLGISDHNKMVLWPGCEGRAEFSLHTKNVRSVRFIVKRRGCCCNLSGGVALIVWFTTNGMCVKNNTIDYVWHEQAITEWSWHVNSIVACCHSVKLWAYATLDFRSQQ